MIQSLMICSIAWHVSGGLYVNIMEQPALVQKNITLPPDFAATCNAWDTWTKTNIPDQIDSGLKMVKE
jgi:hypothetical protein